VKYRPLDEWIAQLDQYTNLKYVTIAGPTSEPTLYPHLFDLIRYLNKRDVEISLFINGDTYNDLYYKKLGVIFRQSRGHVYFTICGSTQELHEKYRVGSNLSNVLRRLDIIEQYSGKGILTWIIFNYNKNDFEQNHAKFNKYKIQSFNTLPVDEHFELSGNIRLPDDEHAAYALVDKTDLNDITCPAYTYKFNLIGADGEVHPCGLHRMYGESHCYECSEKNSNILKEHKIYRLAEAESEDSEIPLRIFEN
jgi:MoaA/NifB/PqqE/SkfB family radical SAM enzyme